MRVAVSLLLLLVLLHVWDINRSQQSSSFTPVVPVQGAGTTESSTVRERKNALRELEASLQVTLSQGQTLEAARTLTRIGGLQLLLNDPEAAAASHTQALDLLSNTPNTELEIDNLNGAAAAYLFLSDKEQLAQDSLDKAVRLSRQFGYTRGEAQSLLLLSDLQNINDHVTALATAQASLVLWKALGDNEAIARTYIQIGTCYLAQYLPDDAKYNFDQALEIARSLNNSAREAEALTMLGFTEYRKGDWQATIDYSTQAYGMLDENAEAEMMAKLSSGMGGAFNEIGLPETALVQYQHALKSYQQTKDAYGVSYALYGIGRTYFLLGDLTEATNFLQQSFDAAPKNSLYPALALQYLGRIHTERGEYADALEKLGHAVRIYTKAKNFREATQVQALIAQVYERQGAISTARSRYREAIAFLDKISDRVNQAAVSYALGQLEMKQGNYEVAAADLKQSLQLTENIRRVSTSTDLTAAFSANVQDRYEAYIECLMKLHEQQPARGFAVNAFETSELGRGRALAEMVALQSNVVPGVAPDLAAREKTLRLALRLIDNKKIQLLGEKDNEQQLKTLEVETTTLENDYKEITEQIRSRYPAYDDITKPASWDLRQIQEKLLSEDDAVLLEYSLGTENSYAWTVTRNGFTSYKLPSRTVINDASKKLYTLLSAPPEPERDNDLNQASSELSKLVLAPIAASLNKRRVIVVPDGALHYVPFQLLSASAKSDEPLVSTFEVVNVPSASILGQLRQEKQQRRPATKVLAAFGDPVFASNYAQHKDSSASEILATDTETSKWQHAWRDIEVEGDKFDPYSIQPLLYTKRELKNLTEIAGPSSRVVSGFEASRKTLDSLDLSQYSILHFATHGLLDPKRPEHSGIFLSMIDQKGHPQDGFITMQDVYRLHAPVDLVVLSACRTGLGKDVRGEGLIGLTRGFMYAGASSVVASLWRVDDEATSELMKQFYTNMLQKGMRPPEALRSAQNTLRQNPEWQSPHFWAGFVLQGEFKEPIRMPAPTGAPRAVQNTVGIAFLLLLLTGIGWGYLRRRTTKAI